MIRPAATLRRLTAADAPLLEVFFHALVASGTDAMFHPHAFDAQTAARVCGQGRDDAAAGDEYHAIIEHGRIVAYGMLRGWSEGYAVPSLGIAVLPECRRRGLAQQLMDHLHHVAAARGATTVRLKGLGAQPACPVAGARVLPERGSQSRAAADTLIRQPRHLQKSC